ncbi:TetR/AcrR family transcriptional regulator [Paenibacillus sp. UNC499MF]|uniref:TetR/AcrR family transcriptional regulator n=1 Tax=Paenibacillus sp. UNC499MF TaxID=1502751 RepID=UPI0008A04F6E|nr:TetR/AcrR family transcriptional regulator [Paenibacillus sp. UNC499MF]SEG47440.1 transcriptional regulator, TetR family [Paenibacillus sp. UNC499MF]
MQPGKDRRTIRTKEGIRKALTELMEEKGFNCLTVRDITTRADINRGTFYLHYKDKFDLLEQSLQEIFSVVDRIVEGVKASLTPNIIVFDEPLPFAVALFEYFEANGDFLKAVLGPEGAPGFQNRMKQLMREKLFENHSASFIPKDNLLVPADYFISYLTSAHLGVVQEWLQGGRRESPREMALILTRLTFNGPLYAAGLNPAL